MMESTSTERATSSSSSSVLPRMEGMPSDQPPGVKRPVKGSMVLTLPGLASSMLARSSPASITAPAAFAWLILPVSWATSGMTIFMASTSAKGLPFWISAPSGCRKRMSLPVTSVRSSEGSNWVGSRCVLPSSMRRMPSGSSVEVTLCVDPAYQASRVPSLCSRTLASTIVLPMLKRNMPGAKRDTSNSYLTSRYVISTGNLLSDATPCVPSWPLEKFCRS
mmetsp:Transcript_30156/g.77435  ORF Transcript_30156/g.77435 Transcript_30156/m.77435 type:complete len:221 (-) Transcript_30156:944-1606(-)